MTRHDITYTQPDGTRRRTTLGAPIWSDIREVRPGLFLERIWYQKKAKRVIVQYHSSWQRPDSLEQVGVFYHEPDQYALAELCNWCEELRTCVDSQ